MCCGGSAHYPLALLALLALALALVAFAFASLWLGDRGPVKSIFGPQHQQTTTLSAASRPPRLELDVVPAFVLTQPQPQPKIKKKSALTTQPNGNSLRIASSCLRAARVVRASARRPPSSTSQPPSPEPPVETPKLSEDERYRAADCMQLATIYHWDHTPLPPSPRYRKLALELQ
ncbi:hypothetical protein HYFRA_00011297 [Hymenoscyphus fraxineus]|uniref:Uncharacterized protein n=1 Tax=Hymenoscyphus fraxineus TaxID=746836 RepID=A0A9N9KVX4_9HELO|nr:hypothetical protein HYFRA_00011297 [Hymenoscyphus fraxineus]